MHSWGIEALIKIFVILRYMLSSTAIVMGKIRYSLCQLKTNTLGDHEIF